MMIKFYIKNFVKYILQLVIFELKEKIENFVEFLFILWILCKDFVLFYIVVKDFVIGLQKYLLYMFGMKERIVQNLRKLEFVRSFKDNWSFKKVGKVKDVKDEYKKFDDFLKNVVIYMVKDLIDFEGSGMIICIYFLIFYCLFIDMVIIWEM